MRKKDLSWLIILVISGLLFLNLLIPKKPTSALIKPPVVTEAPPKKPEESLNLANLIGKFSKENRYAAIKHLELMGTVIGEPSVAVIYNLETKEQGSYQVNDQVGDFKLAGILARKVILLKDGEEWELPLKANQNGSVFSTDESGTIIVDKFRILSQVFKVNDVVKNVKILPVPDTETNKLKGFQIDNIPAGSLIEEAGIKSGDIICEVQGKKLESMQDAFAMFDKVQRDSHIEVVLLRGGQPFTLKYEIKN